MACIPIACIGCGNPLTISAWEKTGGLLRCKEDINNNPESCCQVFKTLGIHRQCCKVALLTSVDHSALVLKYYQKPGDDPLTELDIISPYMTVRRTPVRARRIESI